jgi:hypothetical protein
MGLKANAVVYIGSWEDNGRWVNICIVTPDQKEHEVILRKENFKEGNWIPAEYSVHPSCCEHPNGCPEESRTQKFLREYNEKNGYL